jgi:hypothetical protein
MGNQKKVKVTISVPEQQARGYIRTKSKKRMSIDEAAHTAADSHDIMQRLEETFDLFTEGLPLKEQKKISKPLGAVATYLLQAAMQVEDDEINLFGSIRRRDGELKLTLRLSTPKPKD